MQSLMKTLFAAALLCLPVLGRAGAEEDALKALDDANVHVMALSAVKSPSLQNFQSAQGELSALKPFFDNVAKALALVPLDSSSQLLSLGTSVEAKIDTAGKISTVNLSVFIDTCRGLQGDLDQWQALLPAVRNALQQRVDAKTQQLVVNEVVKTFPSPMPAPAGNGPSAVANPFTPTPPPFIAPVQPTPTPVPGMLATPVPASVADGGVIPGGWTPPPAPAAGSGPAPVTSGGTPQPTPRAAAKLPVAIAVGHNNQRVWVANVRANSVGVMDAGTQRFTAEIPVGAQPQALALDDSDSTLVVANYGANSVTLVDAKKDSVLKTQAVAAGPMQVLVTHNQKAYVLCQDGRSVAVIDLKLKLLLKSIPLSSRPGRMDQPSSNQQIYVTLPDEDSVAVIDTGYDDVAAVVKE